MSRFKSDIVNRRLWRLPAVADKGDPPLLEKLDKTPTSDSLLNDNRDLQPRKWD